MTKWPSVAEDGVGGGGAASGLVPSTNALAAESNITGLGDDNISGVITRWQVPVARTHTRADWDWTVAARCPTSSDADSKAAVCSMRRADTELAAGASATRLGWCGGAGAGNAGVREEEHPRQEGEGPRMLAAGAAAAGASVGRGGAVSGIGRSGGCLRVD